MSQNLPAANSSANTCFHPLSVKIALSMFLPLKGPAREVIGLLDAWYIVVLRSHWAARYLIHCCVPPTVSQNSSIDALLSFERTSQRSHWATTYSYNCIAMNNGISSSVLSLQISWIKGSNADIKNLAGSKPGTIELCMFMKVIDWSMYWLTIKVSTNLEAQIEAQIEGLQEPYPTPGNAKMMYGKHTSCQSMPEPANVVKVSDSPKTASPQSTECLTHSKF